MKWTISVWADWNSISVNFYPLVPFISIFSPVLLLRILQVQYGRHQGISVQIPHPLFLYQTEASRAEKIFFRPPSIFKWRFRSRRRRRRLCLSSLLHVNINICYVSNIYCVSLKAYYAKKSKKDKAVYSENLKKVQEDDEAKKKAQQQQDSIIEMMKMQMRDAQERADKQLEDALNRPKSVSSVSTDPEIYELRDEVDKLENKLDDMMNQLDEKENENRRLGEWQFKLVARHCDVTEFLVCNHVTRRPCWGSMQ